MVALLQQTLTQDDSMEHHSIYGGHGPKQADLSQEAAKFLGYQLEPVDGLYICTDQLTVYNVLCDLRNRCFGRTGLRAHLNLPNIVQATFAKTAGIPIGQVMGLE
jgi:hypothetical protein